MENTNYTWILAYETLCDLVAWYEHAYSSCVYLNINYKNEKKVQILEILSNTFVYSGNCVRGNYAQKMTAVLYDNGFTELATFHVIALVLCH